ncbi:programmed cell death protein [Achlya hypogyna]|uniref:Programmed cell death protein n=1 Tax=Achlya hypogyna TaxID=1202772 RepID=A0A1V9Z9G0_ACHHY|nr:programmed cell death protein [Achlya hypogyna]
MSASRRNSKDLAHVDPETAAMAEAATSGALSFAGIDLNSTTETTEKVEPVKDRSKSRELAKKMGGGKKGLWGKPEDLITTPPIDHDDPNFDSEEETDDVVFVTTQSPRAAPPLSPRTRSLSKIALVDGNPRAFGNATVPAEVKKEIEEIVTEYFVSGEVSEVKHRIEELAKKTSETYNYEFVKRAITMSMDKHEKERESVSRLLSELYLNGLSPLEISQGFRRVLITADDLALDIPSAINMLSIFAARAVVDEIVPPKFLEDSFLAKNAQPVVAEAIKKLSIKHGTVRMEKGWGPGDGRPVEELKVAIDQLTKEYLLSRDLDEASACVRELNVEHFHHEVVKRGIINSFEDGSDACHAMCSLFAFLVSQDIVSTLQVLKGFERVKLALPDIKLDVPAAEGLFATVVTRSKSDGILPASFHA